jgi:hypothetical protein
VRRTFLSPIDQFKNIVLPPGGSLHRADGQQIEPAEVPAYVGRGELLEIRQDGKPIGKIRPPNETDRFSPNMMEAMGRMLQVAQKENYSRAVNWILRRKDRFWCPMCAKNQSHPMFFGLGITRTRVQPGLLLRDL